ncbi:tRNA-dihydrouridine(16/17) synthase [NAD(P)(+)]-like [Schistosoma japonicum]|nr:tRNA-dihydrouridine(16/17) synthase [NAD(P)(+)]-like [Schistosoma japonicum]KAH8855617.1 tRNA-dihydrouridine(16/17) synthase [NAD(P)(+)]-like [Schistosoma japonicum]KAH8855622.1 tRNA-dihydrouridine(16/17) synthase [NAD(P)(+)]-like [Schistosoma japonicum]
MSLLDSWKSPKYVLAPMVDGSELAWRMLGRKYGVQLTFTPMINSTSFLVNKKYRHSCLQFASEDRPIIVQFCANSPDTFIKCAKLVQPFCDAVDLNLGCPQGIAKKGHYGAFLQDEWDCLKHIISRASSELSVPVTCKIRIFSDVDRTVQYAKLLEAAGASMLTVHGRTREMKGQKTGLADWNQIRAGSSEDTCYCQRKHPVLIRRSSMFRFNKSGCSYECRLDEHPEYRSLLGSSQSAEGIKEILQKMANDCSSCTVNSSNVLPHPHWLCQPYERPITFPVQENLEISTQTVSGELNFQATDKNEPTKKVMLTEQRRSRKALKKEAKLAKKLAIIDGKLICTSCNKNRKSVNCVRLVCRPCCQNQTGSNLNSQANILCPLHYRQMNAVLSD